MRGTTTGTTQHAQAPAVAFLRQAPLVLSGPTATHLAAGCPLASPLWTFTMPTLQPKHRPLASCLEWMTEDTLIERIAKAAHHARAADYESSRTIYSELATWLDEARAWLLGDGSGGASTVEPPHEFVRGYSLAEVDELRQIMHTNLASLKEAESRLSSSRPLPPKATRDIGYRTHTGRSVLFTRGDDEERHWFHKAMSEEYPRKLWKLFERVQSEGDPHRKGFTPEEVGHSQGWRDTPVKQIRGILQSWCVKGQAMTEDGITFRPVDPQGQQQERKQPSNHQPLQQADRPPPSHAAQQHPQAWHQNPHLHQLMQAESHAEACAPTFVHLMAPQRPHDQPSAQPATMCSLSGPTITLGGDLQRRNQLQQPPTFLESPPIIPSAQPQLVTSQSQLQQQLQQLPWTSDDLLPRHLPKPGQALPLLPARHSGATIPIQRLPQQRQSKVEPIRARPPTPQEEKQGPTQSDTDDDFLSSPPNTVEVPHSDGSSLIDDTVIESAPASSGTSPGEPQPPAPRAVPPPAPIVHAEPAEQQPHAMTPVDSPTEITDVGSAPQLMDSPMDWMGDASASPVFIPLPPSAPRVTVRPSAFADDDSYLSPFHKVRSKRRRAAIDDSPSEESEEDATELPSAEEKVSTSTHASVTLRDCQPRAEPSRPRKGKHSTKSKQEQVAAEEEEEEAEEWSMLVSIETKKNPYAPKLSDAKVRRRKPAVPAAAPAVKKPPPSQPSRRSQPIVAPVPPPQASSAGDLAEVQFKTRQEAIDAKKRFDAAKAAVATKVAPVPPAMVTPTPPPKPVAAAAVALTRVRPSIAAAPPVSQPPVTFSAQALRAIEPIPAAATSSPVSLSQSDDLVLEERTVTNPSTGFKNVVYVFVRTRRSWQREGKRLASRDELVDQDEHARDKKKSKQAPIITSRQAVKVTPPADSKSSAATAPRLRAPLARDM